jgi:homoserine kinase
MTTSGKNSHVRIPATSANLGPGFDCMALALDLWNEVDLEEISGQTNVIIGGEGEMTLAKDERNCVAQAAALVYQEAGNRTPSGFTIHSVNRIPIASGLGSSAAAAVGGLLAANKALGYPLTPAALIQLALKIEGHADNAVAALNGGLVILSVERANILWRRYDLPEMRVVVVVPDRPLSTGESRAALPQAIPHEDAVFNIGRALLVTDALRKADYRLLSEAMADRLHQPYRLELFPGVHEIMQAAKFSGSAAAVLSGAGPGVIAFSENRHEIILDSMLKASATAGLPAKGFILRTTNAGADGQQRPESK